MNFLAHLYLSKNNTQIMIGNLIADHIRGNKFTHYSEKIQQGIQLHRKIDTYTDSHEIVKRSKRRLHERYGHYDGVIIDVFYDYFLAKNWGRYSQIPLSIYTKGVYDVLSNQKDILPERTQQLLPSMIANDLLYNYQFLEGVQQVLSSINRRTKGISKMDLALEDLKKNEKDLEDDFFLFFDDLRTYTDKALLEFL